MTGGALVATAALTLLVGSSADGLRVSLRSTANAYLAQIAQVARVAGRDTTYDYFERLNEDLNQLDDPSVPKGYSADEWSATVANIGTLDVSLATQLLARSYQPMATIRGLGETFVRSSKDGTMQPVAVYVPRSYEASRHSPLVLLLHGRPQSETQLLAPPFVGQLAEATGTIVIAPWGRGYYNFRESADDVYDALHAAEGAFAIDERKQYLAGYSMGGFSVFEVAPIHPDDWAAVMCISGALLGSDAPRVLARMARTPFYVLTGSADDSIPTAYPTASAAFLENAGVDVSFYSESGGTHRLVTLLPILTQAWNDMAHGVVRAPPPVMGVIKLPSEAPAMTTKP
jgi:pimeloyl-ACP methyl ester carboxylesterase